MKSYQSKTQIGLWLVIFLFSLLCHGQNAFAQEIPNGDGDLLWEKPLNGRTVNDAKFHPINGNIIAAVNHEIWEIDPKDGHTIRVFKGSGQSEIKYFQISNDGKYIVSGGAEKWIIIWDYQTGTILKILDNIKQIPVYNSIGIYPDSKSFVYFTYEIIQDLQMPYVIGSFNVYDIEQQKIIKTVETPSQVSYNKAVDAMQLSIDGKFLAIGFRNREYGVFKDFTMELWNAETLTKIQDLGELPGFIDIQISSDNQYIASIGLDRQFSIFSISSGALLKQSIVDSFRFLNEGNKIIIDDNPSLENKVLNIMKLPEFDTLYNYHRRGSKIRINKKNEIFSVGFDTTIGAKMQYFSNRWYEVGENEPKEPQPTISPNPASDYIEVNVGANGHLPQQEIRIFDIFGKQVLSVETQCIASLQKIDISTLSAGVYFVRIWNEKPVKFVVVR